MNTPELSAGRIERYSVRFSRFLAGGTFAAFTLWLLFFYEVFVAFMTFAPIGSGALGSFVEDFRIRCYQYEPQTGWMQWSSAVVMLAEPLPLAAIILGVWYRPFLDVWRLGVRALLPTGAAAAVVIGLIGAGLSGARRATPLPPAQAFPAGRLRSDLPMPPFQLTDQDGQTVSPSTLQGRVVLVTAVYSTCTTACPMMLKRIRDVLDQLSPAERARLDVVAFSLNPEADTREMRAAITRVYGFEGTQFHFVNGQPAEMNALLDQLNISRTRDEKTGQIVHSNLFLLLDRRGRIAYRLTLSDREQTWVTDALRVLLTEIAG